MGNMRPSVALVVLLTACGTSGKTAAIDDPRAAARASHPEAAELRQDILARVEADQAVRLALMQKQQQGQQPDSLDAARLQAVDTANTRWLKRVVAVHGWPGRSLVGRDGAQAAFLLVQHADADTAFQAQVLPLLERAYAEGDVEGAHVALLTDRLAAARGQPQVYGSQADIVDGRVVLKPIADSAGVDARRARVGLPPLTEYVRLLDSLYTGGSKP
jgi:hypothetical protein